MRALAKLDAIRRTWASLGRSNNFRDRLTRSKAAGHARPLGWLRFAERSQ
jgi:hypothetical protein